MKKFGFLVLFVALSFTTTPVLADNNSSSDGNCSGMTTEQCDKYLNALTDRMSRENSPDDTPKDIKKKCDDSYKDRTKAMKDRTDDITKEKKDNRESIDKLTEDLLDLQKQQANIDPEKDKALNELDKDISKLKKSLSDDSQQMVDQLQEIDVQLNELVTTKLNSVLADYSNKTSQALTECRAQAAKNAKVMYELIQKEALDKRSGKFVARTTDRSFGGKSDLARVQDLATNGGTVEGANFEGYNDCIKSRQKTADDNRDLAISNLKSQEMSLRNKSQSLQNKLNTATGAGNEEMAAKFKEKQSVYDKAQLDKIDIAKKIAQKQEQIQKKQTITDVNNAGVDQATEDAFMACCECSRPADTTEIDENASPSDKKKAEKALDKFINCKSGKPKDKGLNTGYQNFCKNNGPGKTKAKVSTQNGGNQ